MVGMQGIGWCDMGMGFRCVSGCSAVWVEIGAEMLASRGTLCVTLHHRNAHRERND